MVFNLRLFLTFVVFGVSIALSSFYSLTQVVSGINQISPPRKNFIFSQSYLLGIYFDIYRFIFTDNSLFILKANSKKN